MDSERAALCVCFTLVLIRGDSSVIGQTQNRQQRKLRRICLGNGNRDSTDVEFD